jgi:outer membrane protein OmpA-like peptidoglycan-associated protein
MALSLRDEEPAREPDRSRRSGNALIAVLLLLLLVGVSSLGFLAYRSEQRTRAMERDLASLTVKSDEAAALARQALDRSFAAETSARAAAEGRLAAETQTAAAQQETATARQETQVARDEATTAKEAAARAEAEAERIRKKAEAEVNRLEAALGQVAETRRTALGLVMNLGSDYLKFEFDKADLRAEDRELLSRIAGIMLTSQDYTISVNGHTDDVGSDAYNQKLSERRAQAVHDYLVKAGLPKGILSVEGHGKSLPLVRGNSDAARAKNRRVELGIVNTRIRYGR